QGKCARGPKVPAALRWVCVADALSCRRLDRRRAVAPTLRQAVVELALLEHGIGEPNPAAHHDDEKKQQERVGAPAIARELHVFVALGRFGLVHGLTVARGGDRRNGRGASHPAMVSFTTLTSCLSVNGLARKLNCF